MVAPIGRVQVIMSGFAGAPGLMQFYWNGAAAGSFTSADATSAVAAVRALLAGCVGALPSSVGLQVQSAVETMEATTGQLIGVEAATPVSALSGTATGSVIVAQGALIQWFTGLVVGRRLLRGRTFLTPSTATVVTSTGTVVGALQVAILAACATYIATAGPSPVIWHRPIPYATGANGVASEIVSAQVPVTVAVLRSRRD